MKMKPLQPTVVMMVKTMTLMVGSMPQTLTVRCMERRLDSVLSSAMMASIMMVMDSLTPMIWDVMMVRLQRTRHDQYLYERTG